MKIKEFLLERYFAKYEFNSPYLLCSSDCESFTVQELFDMVADEGERLHLQQQFMNLSLGYTESQGHPKLKKEICKLYSTVQENQVLVAAGAEEAIFIVFNSLLDKQDHVIVHHPCYQSLTEIVASIGCDTTLWKTQHDNNWKLDIEFLKQSIKPTTKLIIMNFPHNPTGYQISKENYLEVLKIAREHNIYVFADEVYRFLEHHKDPAKISSMCDISAVDPHILPAACDVYDKAISLGVMSKSFGLAGLRIGWIICKEQDLYRSVASYKDYTSICNSAPSEFLSILALQNKEKLIARNLTIIQENKKLLQHFFTKYSRYFEWVEPTSGPIAFPKINSAFSVEAFCQDLIEKKGVLLLPSNCYQYGDHHFRLGFARKNMSEALQKLEEYLEEGNLEKLQ